MYLSLSVPYYLCQQCLSCLATPFFRGQAYCEFPILHCGPLPYTMMRTPQSYCIFSGADVGRILLALKPTFCLSLCLDVPRILKCFFNIWLAFCSKLRSGAEKINEGWFKTREVVNKVSFGGSRKELNVSPMKSAVEESKVKVKLSAQDEYNSTMRPPPPGYEKWLSFAKERQCHLGPYLRIEKDLEVCHLKLSMWRLSIMRHVWRKELAVPVDLNFLHGVIVPRALVMHQKVYS